MWVTAEANYKPNTVDTTTSKVYNYIRRNIHQEQHEDDPHRRADIFCFL